MWILVALGVVVVLILAILLQRAGGRARTLHTEIAQAELKGQQLQAQLLQAQASAHQHHARAEQAQARAQDAEARAHDAGVRAERAQAKVDGLVDVEQRYRGVMAIEAIMVQLERRRQATQQQIEVLDGEVGRLRHELAALTDEDYFADFGIYSTRYDFATSESYKAALDAIRDQQKSAVKAGAAAFCHVPWTVEGSQAKGKKMTADNLKLMIRAFNGECDASIAKVTYKNIAALEQRIWKAKERIDRLNAVNRCELMQSYVQLKIEELRLFHEYAMKKEEERQEQRELKEQIREEKRAQQELERMRKQAEDEEARYAAALAKAREESQRATGAKQARMAQKIAELEARLLEAHTNKERAISQAQLTRSGHVYVISNVGSFGEGVYKIGMTRRLEPMDRVKELGDASVPFAFDVHALIRSHDAPTLERDLHRRFAERRVNRVNMRKEFFQVSLHEIGAAVTELHGEIELTKLAEAPEYRQSLALREEQSRKQAPALGMTTPRSAAVAEESRAVP